MIFTQDTVAQARNIFIKYGTPKCEIRFLTVMLFITDISLTKICLTVRRRLMWVLTILLLLHSRQQRKRRYDTNSKSFSVTREGNLVTMKVEADGFLYNMVRIMVGTLLRIQQGKIPVDGIAGIIEKKTENLQALQHSPVVCILTGLITIKGLFT